MLTVTLDEIKSKCKIPFLSCTATFQGLDGHMKLGAVTLDRAMTGTLPFSAPWVWG